MVLYNDRVFSFEKAAGIEHIIDANPSEDNIKELVMWNRRNQQAQEELVSYHTQGKFLYVHPLTTAHQTTNEYILMKQTQPGKFLDEVTNAKKYIDRYKSLIRNNKYKDQEEYIKYRDHLASYEHKLELMQAVLNG